MQTVAWPPLPVLPGVWGGRWQRSRHRTRATLQEGAWSGLPAAQEGALSCEEGPQRRVPSSASCMPEGWHCLECVYFFKSVSKISLSQKSSYHKWRETHSFLPVSGRYSFCKGGAGPQVPAPWKPASAWPRPLGAQTCLSGASSGPLSHDISSLHLSFPGLTMVMVIVTL